LGVKPQTRAEAHGLSIERTSALAGDLHSFWDAELRCIWTVSVT